MNDLPFTSPHDVPMPPCKEPRVTKIEILSRRDKFVMAAITGMLANPNFNNLYDYAVIKATVKFADLAIEYIKDNP